MGYPASVIPEKLFFKIGEVCEIVGVQPHVLRYWETEFPMLSPQKNRSGQRTYRRRDVEIALRIKELLYEELYTIAGAKKKLQAELRESNKLKVLPPTTDEKDEKKEIVDFRKSEVNEEKIKTYKNWQEEEEDLTGKLYLSQERREALLKIASELLELREMLKKSSIEDETIPKRFT
ncbi:MAG: MerR family transcriptional regulator [Pyrinomonadaceae bacterium]|nr:MerR family transcriptional regulator [Pyrinomonadaceae bacterium]MCX7639435.1 MerR family transcriptional regulator [Pyrinomonadaceae bacterium]MDW8304515.1 MerR family transcriptional regulator [Acidobacteriota bacterium]